MEPNFLGLADVIRIHEDQIKRYGGIQGIREAGLLQSAVATPQATYGGQYLHESIFDMASAYLFHIVKNHAFIDGNKRTGAAAAIVFLLLNNIDINAPEDSFEAIVRSVAVGNAGKAEVSEFFRKYSLT
jgi:death-on-curing protein